MTVCCTSTFHEHYKQADVRVCNRATFSVWGRLPARKNCELEDAI
jgi:hypothetical protein